MFDMTSKIFQIDHQNWWHSIEVPSTVGSITRLLQLATKTIALAARPLELAIKVVASMIKLSTIIVKVVSLVIGLPTRVNKMTFLITIHSAPVIVWHLWPLDCGHWSWEKCLWSPYQWPSNQTGEGKPLCWKMFY